MAANESLLLSVMSVLGTKKIHAKRSMRGPVSSVKGREAGAAAVVEEKSELSLDDESMVHGTAITL